MLYILIFIIGLILSHSFIGAVLYLIFGIALLALLNIILVVLGGTAIAGTWGIHKLKGKK